MSVWPYTTRKPFTIGAHKCHLCQRTFDDIGTLEDHLECEHDFLDHVEFRVALADETENPNPWDEYRDILEDLGC
jgi:hypothetical protein